jgi:hypothetical protein
MLTKISIAMQEAYRDNTKPQIRSGTKRITGKYTQSTAVRGHGRIESYFHRKVSDISSFRRYVRA